MYPLHCMSSSYLTFQKWVLSLRTIMRKASKWRRFRTNIRIYRELAEQLSCLCIRVVSDKCYLVQSLFSVLMLIYNRYFDGELFATVQQSQLTGGLKFDVSPHYWIINTAVGGNYPTNPDSTTPFPNYHSTRYSRLNRSLMLVAVVDYVRVYTWKTSCSDPNVCSKHGCCFSSNITCACDAGWYGSACEYWWGK